MLEDITIKQVLNMDGSFSHLELHQDGNVIKLNLGNADMDVQRKLYKWANLKKAIDGLYLPPSQDNIEFAEMFGKSFAPPQKESKGDE